MNLFCMMITIRDWERFGLSNMKSLSLLPQHIRKSLTPKERAAIEILKDEPLEAYFQYETKLFEGIGYIGPGGKFTKPANPEKYEAILILEERIRKELNGEIKYP